MKQLDNERASRGEQSADHVVKLNCGCIMVWDEPEVNAHVVYCPKHEVTPNMYEAFPYKTPYKGKS